MGNDFDFVAQKLFRGQCCVGHPYSAAFKIRQWRNQPAFVRRYSDTRVTVISHPEISGLLVARRRCGYVGHGVSHPGPEYYPCRCSVCLVLNSTLRNSRGKVRLRNIKISRPSARNRHLYISAVLPLAEVNAVRTANPLLVASSTRVFDPA
jgi:hypothetical protein